MIPRLALAALLLGVTAAAAPAEPQFTPTGQRITPDAARGARFQMLDPELKGLPEFRAGQASALATSPDGRTLLILTSGFNRNFGPDAKLIPEASREYVFVYDVSGPEPVKRQVLSVPNSFLGLAWSPRGDRFYVSGGVEDCVFEFVRGEDGFAPGRTFALGHEKSLFKTSAPKPEAGRLAVSPEGARLLVANFQNDSVSLIDLASGRVIVERDLRPGKIDPARRGQPGGTFPNAVAFIGPDRAVVTSQRDRELIELALTPAAVTVGRRTTLRGQPSFLLPDRSGRRLFIAQDNTDLVSVMDLATSRILENIPTVAPRALLQGRALHGAGTNGLALSPDGATLLASNGGENALAVIRLGAAARGEAPAPARREADDGPAGSAVVGLIPTGWYPTAVAVSADGSRIYAVNGKSPPGPNPGGCRNSLAVKAADAGCRPNNQYVWQLEKAGFLTLPVPSAPELGRLTRLVAENDRFASSAQSRADAASMRALRQRIHHVIYIVKENRTYDQVLGDLKPGDGDPRLALFPERITPNHHALARSFVTLDRFFDSGESSNTGWQWSTSGRTTDFTEREAPVNYAQRGLQYDQEGVNRLVNVGPASLAERRASNPTLPDDPDLMAGQADVAAPDGPGQGDAYIWDAAFRAGKTVRNFGFFGDLSRHEYADAASIPLERDPARSGTRVFFPTKPALVPVTDPYYRGFDMKFADFWRFQEWKREFDAMDARGSAPDLMLVRLPHDHLGEFGAALDGVNTPETQVADNDYALGMLVERVSKSRFAKDTLIMVVEDDAQDGADHVDAHRSIAFIAGPYVRKGAVISTRYTTVNLLRTLEDVLGLKPWGLNDSLARPMSEVFDLRQSPRWSFRAQVPAVLRSTQLPLPAGAQARVERPRRSAAWWEAAMQGQDFSAEDRLDTARFNRVLWLGLKGR